MKFILTITINFLLFVSGIYGQSNLRPMKDIDTLHISDVKTTHLLFHDNIKYVDIGSPYFVADTLQQIIRLKHIGEEASDGKGKLSNLTVITGDGGFYSMVLEYDRFTPLLSYEVDRSQEFVPSYLASEEKVEEEKKYYDSLCNETERLESNVILRNKRGEDLLVYVTGLFYVDEKIGVRLEIHNGSTIDFDIDQILFRTKLKKRISQDYLYQERVTLPIYTCSSNFEVLGNGNSSITLLFDKFMPNENERLFIDIFEKNGGRSATIMIPRRKLLNPKIVYLHEKTP